MLTFDQVEKLWDNFDPFHEHELGDDFCPACFAGTRTCHVCGSLLHSNSVEVPDDETDPGSLVKAVEYVCEECGYTSIE